MALQVHSESILTGKLGCSGLAVIIMGVSGSGKSTIGAMLAKVLSCDFLDADNFHEKKNIEKMRNGEALTDEDRFPWLEKLRDVLSTYLNRGKPAVLACSALRSSYRDVLRAAAAQQQELVFVHLRASEFLVSRLETRFKDGDHYMPPSLLKSQFACLEMRADEEDIIEVETNTEPSFIVEEIVNRLTGHFLAKSN